MHDFPGSRLGKWSAADPDVGCGVWDDAEDQLWKFVKPNPDNKPGYYYIYNKKYTTARLALWSGGWGQKWGTFTGRKYNDQLFKPTNVGGNRFRINSNVSGREKFGMWSKEGCGWGDWADDDDQIWSLVEG